MAPAGGSDRHDWELAERRRVRVTLSSRRDRLTAIGRRRSDVAKTELYWGARRWRAHRLKIFVSESESERVSGRGGQIPILSPKPIHRSCLLSYHRVLVQRALSLAGCRFPAWSVRFALG